MRPVFLRELKELLPALAVALTFAVMAGTEATGPLFRQLDDMLALACGGGLFAGLWQGALDRWRKNDLFALHRPTPAARMEAARTLAGAVVVLLMVGALVLARWLATLAELADIPRRRIAGIGYEHNLPLDQLGGAEVALTAAILLAAWAVVRFAAGAARERWAVPALIALPFAMWSVLSHAATLAAATAFALLLAALFATGSALCLAGDRR